MRLYIMGVLALALLYGLIVAAASGIDGAIERGRTAQVVAP
jgi:hypothetical protein